VLDFSTATTLFLKLILSTAVLQDTFNSEASEIAQLILMTSSVEKNVKKL
jgi:hypothetical protein